MNTNLKINEDWCIQQNEMGQVYWVPGGTFQITRIDPPFLKIPESRFSVHVWDAKKLQMRIEKSFATEEEVMKYIYGLN